MAITTIHPRYTEWYTVNGESMANYGFGITSVQTGMPDRKGENTTSPIIHGDIFREKRFGPRTDSWNIWVSDANPTTGVTPTTEGAKRSQFNSNIEYLNGIFNKMTPYSTKNGTLEIKKFNMVPVNGGSSVSYDSSDSSSLTFSTGLNSHGLSVGDKVSTDGFSPATLNFDARPITAVTSTTFTVANPYGAYDDEAEGFDGSGLAFGTLEKVAYAEVVSSYSIDDHREFNQALISIEVRYPDPRWYSTSSNLFQITQMATATSLSSAYVGNAPVTDMVIVITASGGSLVNPVLSNGTLTDYPGSIGFVGTILSGDSVTIDTGSLTLTKTVSGVTSNSIANLYRGGYRQDWMEIYPSVANSFTLSSSSGSGTADITYTKAYI
jgi:hypothetical protein